MNNCDNILRLSLVEFRKRGEMMWGTAIFVCRHSTLNTQYRPTLCWLLTMWKFIKKNSLLWSVKCGKVGKQDLQKPIISDHVCISFYWGQICPWNDITATTKKSHCWNHRKKKKPWSNCHQFPSMDGSIEGDINELSYSPIVVTVYFVWVCAVCSAYKMIRRHTGATSIVSKDKVSKQKSQLLN